MSSFIRVVVGFVVMAVAASLHALVLLVLFPSRNLRIRACNLWGWVVGPFFVWLSGSKVTLTGAEHLDRARPAIYVTNHTSTLDIFIGIGLGPLGTVGVAKREVVYYPFFGQLYWLSGHLRIDRGHRGRAIAAMQELSAVVRRYRLSIWMWPEGTRSRDGRLLPFKKGIYHLAIGTGLPVVPVVIAGAQQTWVKGTMKLRPCDITVDVLPAIDTSTWADQDCDDVIASLRQVFIDALPEAQRPLTADAAAAGA